MKLKIVFYFLVVFIISLGLIGCGEDGDTGPQGPEGPQGETGPAGSGDPDTYLGNDGEACSHCHAQIQMTWHETAHSHAFASLEEEDQNNPYCIQCHTTGWDATVAYGDTAIMEGNEGPDMYGYDNYFQVDTPEAAAKRAALDNVQCEACHEAMGPIDELSKNHGAMSFSTHNNDDGESTSICAPCHSGQLTEWVESGHAKAGVTYADFQNQYYSHNEECLKCHASEGFIRENDYAYANYNFGSEISQIGCVTCHDPHAESNEDGYSAQLRQVGVVYVEYAPGYSDESGDYPAFDSGTNAQICAQCHHARRTVADVEDQIQNGSSHMGPHGSPQMDMFIGYGCYEIEGYDYARESLHNRLDDSNQYNVTEACVECHMQREAIIHGTMEEHSFHTFAPDAGNCDACHSVNDDFTHIGANGGQPAVLEKMDELAQSLGYSDLADFEANFNSRADDVTNDQRKAAYALYFIINDGSSGTHNITYALSLLQNAIDYLATL